MFPKLFTEPRDCFKIKPQWTEECIETEREIKDGGVNVNQEGEEGFTATNLPQDEVEDMIVTDDTHPKFQLKKLPSPLVDITPSTRKELEEMGLAEEEMEVMGDDEIENITPEVKKELEDLGMGLAEEEVMGDVDFEIEKEVVR